MTTYHRGDIVLVPFGFTNQSQTKWRPAVVVCGDGYNQGPDVVIASITSNLQALPHPGDHRLRGWKSAGLLKPSIVQTKLATVEAALIGRRLGHLTAADLQEVAHGLREALELR